MIGIFKSYDNVLRWMSQDLTDDQVNVGSGNGLVPSGNKPLPEPVLTQIYAPYGITRGQWVNIGLMAQGLQKFCLGQLTHCGPEMPYDVEDLGQHWFR